MIVVVPAAVTFAKVIVTPPDCTVTFVPVTVLCDTPMGTTAGRSKTEMFSKTPIMADGMSVGVSTT